MTSTIVRIDARQIRDWDSFHDFFAETLGFPDFYGRNMNAWIDCMENLEGDDVMTSVRIPKGGVLTLHFDHMADLADRCPDIYSGIVECSAFVNFSRIDMEREPVLALSFEK